MTVQPIRGRGWHLLRITPQKDFLLQGIKTGLDCVGNSLELVPEQKAAIEDAAYDTDEDEIDHDQSLIAAMTRSTVVANFSASSMVLASTMSNLQPVSSSSSIRR